MSARALLLSLAAALAASTASAAPSSPEGEDALAACTNRALELIGRHGGTPTGEPEVAFLKEGQSRSNPFTLAEDGCVGVLAVGRRRVQDLDVVLHTASGITVERDVSIDPFAYVRYCGARGLGMVVTVHMYKGMGEYRLVRIKNAPPLLPDLGRAVGGCFASGAGVRGIAPDVGPEPPGPSLSDRVGQLTTELEQLGYRRYRTLERGVLSERETTQESMWFDAARCYAVAALGGGTTRDIDMLLRRPDMRPLARDVARARDAVVKFCAEEEGDYLIEVRMYDGEGPWELTALELDEPPSDERTPGLTGRVRVPYVETLARIERIGMKARPFAWGMAVPGRRLAMPLSLEAGRCYAFAGVPSEELGEGDLDLVLVDDAGKLLGWDVSPGSQPMLYHCATRSGVHRIIGRAYGARGRYLLVVGEDRKGGTSP